MNLYGERWRLEVISKLPSDENYNDYQMGYNHSVFFQNIIEI